MSAFGSNGRKQRGSVRSLTSNTPVTPQPPAPRLVSVANFARALGIAVPTARLIVWRREIPHVRVGRRVLIDEDDIRAFVAARRVPAEPTREGGARLSS